MSKIHSLLALSGYLGSDPAMLGSCMIASLGNSEKKTPQKMSNWPNFKLFGITYLVGKIKFKLFFSGSIG